MTDTPKNKMTLENTEGHVSVPVEPTDEMIQAGVSEDESDDTYRDVRAIYRAMIEAYPPKDNVRPFQERVQPWMLACFGEMIAGDREERNHRFLE